MAGKTSPGVISASTSTQSIAEIVERAVVSVGDVPDPTPEQAEVLRRSIAMLPPQAPSGLSRERVLAILGQLVRALTELRRRGGR